jgi:hypothetical protein
VRWEEYDESWDSWEPESCLDTCQEAIAEYFGQSVSPKEEEEEEECDPEPENLHWIGQRAKVYMKVIQFSISYE